MKNGEETLTRDQSGSYIPNTYEYKATKFSRTFTLISRHLRIIDKRYTAQVGTSKCTNYKYKDERKKTTSAAERVWVTTTCTDNKYSLDSLAQSRC